MANDDTDTQGAQVLKTLSEEEMMMPEAFLGENRLLDVTTGEVIDREEAARRLGIQLSTGDPDDPDDTDSAESASQ